MVSDRYAGKVGLTESSRKNDCKFSNDDDEESHRLLNLVTGAAITADDGGGGVGVGCGAGLVLVLLLLLLSLFSSFKRPIRPLKDSLRSLLACYTALSSPHSFTCVSMQPDLEINFMVHDLITLNLFLWEIMFVFEVSFEESRRACVKVEPILSSWFPSKSA
ncbi:hypothetical protein V1478_011505 [Vespula squamosa]|uniref:Uncharacterized protein n=1 Tax=Vespula squamosa TaxID=30214 RepID=A0ABD2AEP4_VESSQ